VKQSEMEKTFEDSLYGKFQKEPAPKHGFDPINMVQPGEMAGSNQQAELEAFMYEEDHMEL